MRVLVLTTTPREPDNQLLWESLRAFADVDLHLIERKDQRHLSRLLKHFNLKAYDRVVLDLLFRHVSRHAGVLSSVAGLVLYEEDACQEFIPSSRWRGKFSVFYRKLPHARVIFTGHHVAKRFRDLGVDACFLPKGYDSSKLYDLKKPRDIALGFIGRLASDAYQDRRAFVERAAVEQELQILRTRPGNEYREVLNRVSVFLSADVGLGEYMAKNFEAMACGCTLVAFRQGHGEEEALGLIDGKNVVLYGDYSEFAEKLSRLRAEPDISKRIAASGKVLAQQHFDYARQARDFYGFLLPEPQEPAKASWARSFLLSVWPPTGKKRVK